MRIRVSHDTRYAYAAPANYVIQTLRLTPRSHDGQFVQNWHIDIDADCRLDRDEDPFGNVVHTFTAQGQIERLTVTVEGEVETEDCSGVVRGTAERLPLAFWLGETPLTAADPAIRALARDLSAGEGGDRLATLHALMAAIRRDMRFDAGTTSASTTAVEAFAARRGVCQDFAHVFIAAARALGVPARYAGGYLCKGDDAPQEAGHAWAEAHVDGIGWIGFDPANGVCPTEHHVRVAVGPDYLGAAPVRGVRTGGAGETMSVSVVVAPGRRPSAPMPGRQTQGISGQAQSLGGMRQSQGPVGGRT